MDETERRAMQDRHSRDEALLLQSEQHAAGGASGVRPYPAHGEASSMPRSADSAQALVRDYEDALQAERLAWAEVQALPGEPEHTAQAWHDWRAAVEARDRATRHLINYSLGLAQ